MLQIHVMQLWRGSRQWALDRSSGLSRDHYQLKLPQALSALPTSYSVSRPPSSLCPFGARPLNSIELTPSSHPYLFGSDFLLRLAISNFPISLALVMASQASDPRVMSVRPRIRYNTIGGVNGPLVILENVIGSARSFHAPEMLMKYENRLNSLAITKSLL
jgi:hypothetical protein